MANDIAGVDGVERAQAVGAILIGKTTTRNSAASWQYTRASEQAFAPNQRPDCRPDNSNARC
jgi:hypothetical protein